MEELAFSASQRQRIKEVVCYSLVYLFSFFLLEQRHVRYSLLDSALDDAIPFCEYFIIPYVLWFGYIGLTVAWFTLFCNSDGDYFRLSRSLALGGTVFLVISAVFPNGQSLRPWLGSCDNLFQEAVRLLYRVDTPTNVFPSIHVFNSVVCCEAIVRQKQLRAHRWLMVSSVVLTVLIVAATLFLKQHTLLDVAGGLLLATVTSRMFYRRGATRPSKVPQLLHRWELAHQSVF
ncbi:MAG: phosphatase PAP2 family protein [Oscillospiraceae bacterium]|nr:phosphatase PAP2 family protein [Oscillospiraceae bacterium]